MRTIFRSALVTFLLAFCSLGLRAQKADSGKTGEHATIETRKAGEISQNPFLFSGTQTEHFGPLVHPYTIVARHPKDGCDDTATCGEPYYEYHGWNLRTSAGTTWQGNIMLDTSSPPVNNQCNYIALTNTAITPAEADTSLSGEITTNGLARAQGTYSNNSTTLTVPSAPTVTVVGTTGATSYYYWAFAQNQGIYTTISSASSNVTNSNATLSTTNYNQVSFTPVAGAAGYAVLRTTTNSAPTGTVSDLVGGTIGCSAVTCVINDVSNTLASFTVPSSNLTNYGTATLVHTWTATAAQSAQAFGVLTASSSGTMCFEGTFTQVSLNTNDTLQLTETINF